MHRPLCAYRRVVPSSDVSDYRVVAALAHPLRRRLLDVLRVEGPCTASLLAAHTGAAVGSISHHVRVLAGHDLVREVPERARDARERWWRATANAHTWSSLDFADDPAGAIVAETAERMALERQLRLLHQHLAAADDPDDATGAWTAEAFNSDGWLRLSPQELAAFREEVVATITRWRDRPRPDDGVERQPVFTFARAFPARP